MLLLDRLEDLELSKVVDKLVQERVLVVVLALLLDIKLNHLLGHLLDRLLLHIQLLVLVVGLLLLALLLMGLLALMPIEPGINRPIYPTQTLWIWIRTLSIDALTVPAYALAAFMAVVAAARKRERMACWSNYPHPSPFWLCLTGFMMA